MVLLHWRSCHVIVGKEREIVEEGEMDGWMGFGEANCRVAGNGSLPKGKDLGIIQIPRQWALRLRGVMLKDSD